MFTTRSAAVTAINVDIVMLSRRLIAHQSNNPTACPLACTASWNVVCLPLQISIKAECKTGAVIMSIFGLQRFISQQCWAWPWLTTKDCGNCLSSRLWVVCHRCSLLQRHNYLTLPSSACRQSPSARPIHLSQSRHDSATMCHHCEGTGEEVLIISLSELLEIAVRII